jgi:N-carbamoyl-L-amino-acid hydrolase
MDAMRELFLAPALFDELGRRTADPPGWTRPGYSAEEQLGHDLVAAAAARLGMTRAVDPAGNMLLTLPGRDAARMVVIGSHVDTVPHGGNFDGLAGVLAGLETAAWFARSGEPPPLDLSVLVIRSEEATWFPVSYLGSKAALGVLPADALEARRTDTGRTLREHMRAAGFDPDAVARGARLLEPARIAAFVEPHIEQGPLLIEAGIPLGIVTGIRGSFRHRGAACHGEWVHSGAVPKRWRKDAMVAVAELLVGLDALWDELAAAGHDLTVTMGEVATDPALHAFSKVAGLVRFCIDVRALEATTLALVEERLAALVAGIEARRGVRFALGPRSGSTPAPMSEAVQAALERAAAVEGIAAQRMASGAGHDAATFALAGVPAGMLFIRNRNGSHNPDEAMEIEDFAAGVATLRRFVRNLRA